MPTKPFLDKLLAAKDSLTVGMFYNDLARTLAVLTLAEQGRLRDNDGVDYVTCIAVARFPQDKGFATAVFRIRDITVRLSVLSTEKESRIQYLSSVTVMVDHQEVDVSSSFLKKVGFYCLEQWRPSNTLYWVNMMLAWEHRHEHPSA